MSLWTLVESSVAFRNQWLKVNKKTYTHENQPGAQEYFVVERSPFVVVVAIDGSDLLMVRHYRHGTDATYLELPAGYIDEGETAISAARRELREETGFEAAEATLLGELHPLPGYVRSSAHIVACNGLRQVGPIIDAVEIEQVLRVPTARAIDMIVKGEVIEMQAVSAILFANACRLFA